MICPMPRPNASLPSDLPSSALDDGRYLALAARDARFDGRFFTGVTSTGIYCRPVCGVRTPRRENCRFFTLAAQAEAAGFRPCLRCRPELAPRSLPWSTQDAPNILVREALRLLDADGAAFTSLAALAERLGVSDRHLRRVFESALGVSPLQYVQTRRLLAAKQLLTDTDLPVTQVALASGFGSVRRFNAAFAGHYGLNPTQLRQRGPARAGGAGGAGAAVTVRLPWRPPLDVAALLRFFALRQIHALEQIVETPGRQALRRTVRLAASGGGAPLAGWIDVAFDAERPIAWLRVSDALHPVLPQVIARVRGLLDLDADPQAIHAVLGGDFPGGEGLRVPGAFDGFELAVRAVLGQQITVAAARTLAQRLVERFGEPLATPWPELSRLFPAPAVLAAAEGEALGSLGIVRQRQAAIVALARAVDSGQLELHAGADVAATTAALCALPGIGDWTAQYIAMRALRWPDAFPAGDVAVHAALGLRGQPRPAQAATARAEAWRPWRSYAVVRAWTAGSAVPAATATTADLLPKT